MRAITQIIILSNPDPALDRLLALDEDGYLWTTVTEIGAQDAPVPFWEAIPGPGDNPPFMDTRDRLTRLEDSLRAQAKENEALKKRLEDLPGLGGEVDAESET